MHEPARAKYLPDGGHPETVSIIDAQASKMLAESLFDHPAYNQAVALSSGKKCDVYFYRCRAEVDRISREEPEFGAM